MKNQISICKQYPGYWEYDGKPVLLAGGSIEDNLFQIPDIRQHLSLLYRVGGNYVRCTMSSRDQGDVWPFYQGENGIYDLDYFSEEYWKRFEQFLEFTYNLDIIIQIEVWDRFDFAREPWQYNPFNPKNNRNYNVQSSLLKESISSHPGKNENRFFFSIPGYDNNETVLKYQRAFVDKLLSHSLQYPHVLYCIDNETSAVEGWGKYWAEYIMEKAEKEGVEVHITEMWDAWDLMDEQHERTFGHPEIYSFCDISQNNHNCGDVHWEQLRLVKDRIQNKVRPLNNVKIYGSDQSPYGSSKDAAERFFRNILGGAASVRFHRPPSGIGLSDLAQRMIKCARKLQEEFNVFESSSRQDLLINSEKDLVYCAANSAGKVAVLFTGKGRAELDVSKMSGDMEIMWLNIEKCQWDRKRVVENTLRLYLENSLDGMHIAIIRVCGDSLEKYTL